VPHGGAAQRCRAAVLHNGAARRCRTALPRSGAAQRRRTTVPRCGVLLCWGWRQHRQGSMTYKPALTFALRATPGSPRQRSNKGHLRQLHSQKCRFESGFKLFFWQGHLTLQGFCMAYGHGRFICRISRNFTISKT